MSDWIKKAAEQFQQKKDERDRITEIVAVSDFWHKLNVQVSQDVAKINEVFVQKYDLKYPVELIPQKNGFTVAQPSIPAMTIYVKNHGISLEIEKATRLQNEDGFSRETSKPELKISGSQCYLELRAEAYLMPEQAAEFILRPIVQSLTTQIMGDSAKAA